MKHFLWLILMDRFSCASIIYVTYVKKNLCDIFLGTLLNLLNKTKDYINARKDLKKFGIRPALDAKRTRDEKFIYCQPIIQWVVRKKLTYTKTNKSSWWVLIKLIYCVDIKDCRISQLKRHNCHVLLHYFLSLSLRGLLSLKGVYKPIIGLCSFYRDICFKDYSENNFKQLENRVATTLCRFEMIFPSSFCCWCCCCCDGTSEHSSCSTS